MFLKITGLNLGNKKLNTWLSFIIKLTLQVNFTG